MKVKTETLTFEGEHYTYPEIIFHHIDADGYCAAAIALYKYAYESDLPAYPSESICISCKYDNEAEIEAKFNEIVAEGDSISRIVIVDFSFNIDMIERMLARCKNKPEFIWLDHHISSKSLLDEWNEKHHDDENQTVIYSLEECGASLAAKTLLSEKQQHYIYSIVELVKDYDLWIHKYSDSMSFITGLSNHDLDVSSWVNMLSDDIEATYSLVSEGEALIREQKRVAKRIINSKSNSVLRVKGYNMIIINCPGQWINIVSDEILKDDAYDAVLCYNIIGLDKIVSLSLRSKKTCDLDVSAIMKENFNGGGHQHAAGGYTENFKEFVGKVKELED